MTDPSNGAVRPDPSNRCTARTRRGPCRNYPVKGAKVCRMHGGAAPQVRAAAERRTAEAEVTAAADRYAQTAAPVADPLSALLALAGEIVGFKNYLAARVAEMRAEAWRYAGATAEQLRAEVALYERALDRTARVLVDINRLGLEERRTALAEEQGALVADAIWRALEAVGLTTEQRERADVAIVRELRALGGDAG